MVEIFNLSGKKMSGVNPEDGKGPAQDDQDDQEAIAPDPELIAQIETMLEEAKAGHVTAAGICYVSSNGAPRILINSSMDSALALLAGLDMCKELHLQRTLQIGTIQG